MRSNLGGTQQVLTAATRPQAAISWQALPTWARIHAVFADTGYDAEQSISGGGAVLVL
jgi:hypothetical protein